MLTIKELLREVVEELQDKAVRVPTAGSFDPVYAECECDQKAIGLTHIMLRIIPVPAHVNPSDKLRYVEIVGYRLPLPFKSSQIIKRGTKEEISDYLDDVDSVVNCMMEVIPQLGFNLMDI